MKKTKPVLCWCGGKATVVVSWPLKLKVTSEPFCKVHGRPDLVRSLVNVSVRPIEKVKPEKPTTIDTSKLEFRNEPGGEEPPPGWELTGDPRTDPR